MKLTRLALLLAIPLFLTACGLSDQEKADYARVESSGVSSAIYDKMVHGDPLSLYDIKSLTHAGVSDGIILRYLRNSNVVYNLTASDVESLRKAGVSPSIIDYMLQSARINQPYYYPDYGPYYYFGDPFWGGPYWGWGGGYYNHRHWR